MKEILKKLREKIKKEYEEFQQKELKLEPIRLFNDWYLIGFIDSYFEMFMCDFVNTIDEDIIKWLNTFDNPLQKLYELWIEYDDSFSCSFDDMKDWLINLYYEKTN